MLDIIEEVNAINIPEIQRELAHTSRQFQERHWKSMDGVRAMEW